MAFPDPPIERRRSWFGMCSWMHWMTQNWTSKSIRSARGIWLQRSRWRSIWRRLRTSSPAALANLFERWCRLAMKVRLRPN